MTTSMADSPYLIDVTPENFHAVVIEGSHQRPVLVDFWADWCAPCRMLTPILSKLADEYAGKVLVAKLNTEQEQALAAQFGIRSLPTVQLFKDGKPVDQFMGALPEPQIREFLERHIPRESDDLLARAFRCMDSGDAPGARLLIDQARAMDPGNARLQIADARIKMQAGDITGARETLEGVPLEMQDDPDVRRLQGEIAFLVRVADAPPEPELTRRIGADPNDSEARYGIAAHRVARGDYEGALEELLTLLKKDRKYGDDAARKGMLMIFDMLGGEGEVVAGYRAKMLSALY